MKTLTKQSDDTTRAPYMSPETFCRWLADMRGLGIATTDQGAADALGISRRAVSDMKVRGTDRRTALACSALLAGTPPYNEL